MGTEPFDMLVERVWTLADRPYPIVTGPIRSGDVSLGDRVVLSDSEGSAEAVVVGVEFHGGGLVLGDVDPSDLRVGQHVRLAVPD